MGANTQKRPNYKDCRTLHLKLQERGMAFNGNITLVKGIYSIIQLKMSSYQCIAEKRDDVIVWIYEY